MDPETDEKFAQLESSLSLEQQRLEKLWDAYEQQEKDLNAALDRINFLEADIETKETMIASLQELLTERDTKITELEVERQRQSKVEAEYEPRIQAMDTTMNDQTEKYDRLLSITQEMEDELDLARRSLHARDGWFNANVSSLETISEVIKEWRNIQAGKFPNVKEASGPGGGKDEFIAAISKIKGLGAMKAEYEPRIQAMDTTMNDQTEKYDRLLSITQEMEDELDLARRSLHARDGWFNANVSSLETISEVIKEWRNIQAGKFPDVKEASGPGGGKDEFIAAISKIKGLGAMKAENLYDSGFHTVEDLKAANIDDVASVVGFTKLSASKAVNGVKDL